MDRKTFTIDPTELEAKGGRFDDEALVNLWGLLRAASTSALGRIYRQAQLEVEARNFDLDGDRKQFPAYLPTVAEVERRLAEEDVDSPARYVLRRERELRRVIGVDAGRDPKAPSRALSNTEDAGRVVDMMGSCLTREALGMAHQLAHDDGLGVTELRCRREQGLHVRGYLAGHITTAFGPLRVVEDPGMPAGTAYLMDAEGTEVVRIVNLGHL